MARVPSPQLLTALRNLNGPFICQRCSKHLQRPSKKTACPSNAPTRRSFLSDDAPPSAKQIRRERKVIVQQRARAVAEDKEASSNAAAAAAAKTAALAKWELTVGIEIHAELNTTHKLFSSALTSLSDTPNSHVAVFDAALPGAQPQFQKETLLPAVRAALALDCEIQRKSSWDRKHYFWWDQPNGYQITQYYEPFAKNGQIQLYAYDDIDPADYPSITIGIKQIQMEQDTAKTILQPPSTHLLDFNRVSHPLIEIITLPQIHSAKTAAAVVRKVQTILKTVDANTTGMEMGGLRADVNVSVRLRDRSDAAATSGLSYGGITGLGQRTEIKNLNSFKAVEDAIEAERDRQIAILEAGGQITGETRGWTLGGTDTRKIRGKEGEVDYRYMPDPDLGPLVIGQDLIDHLRDTLPVLPDAMLKTLVNAPYSLTIKDAKTLLALNDGERLDFYLRVVHLTQRRLAAHFGALAAPPSAAAETQRDVGRHAANWVLHELGALITGSDDTAPAALARVTPSHVAEILTQRLADQITLPTAKRLLWLALNGMFAAPVHTASAAEVDNVDGARDKLEATEAAEAAMVVKHIHEKNLRLVPMSEKEYLALATKLIADNPKMADTVKKEMMQQKEKEQTPSTAGTTSKDGNARGKGGKIMWFVGQMLKVDAPRMNPPDCDRAVRRALWKMR